LNGSKYQIYYTKFKDFIKSLRCLIALFYMKLPGDDRSLLTLPAAEAVMHFCKKWLRHPAYFLVKNF